MWTAVGALYYILANLILDSNPTLLQSIVSFCHSCLLDFWFTSVSEVLRGLFKPLAIRAGFGKS